MSNTPHRTFRKLLITGLISVFALSGAAFASDQKTTRVGTCEEAKAQSKYWCEERAKVTVIAFGMECENAKINVKEACEGKKTEDKPYTFPSPNKSK